MLAKNYPYYLGNSPSPPTKICRNRQVHRRGRDPCRARRPRGDRSRHRARGRGAETMRRLPAYHRQAVLQHCVKRFQERAEELAMSLCIEAGKPIKDSRGEVSRLVDTFRIAAEESVRLQGEVMTMDITPRARGYNGMWKRVPIGPCSFISPFNFPLNLAAHKIAPALAVGCPFVLKPASLTPVGALLIGEILSETDLPRGAFSILPCRRDGADLFTTDERLKLLSFTGSPEVGWDLKARAGKKKVVLELGGNAAVIVDEDAGLDDAVQRNVFGAFYQSGQSCIGVQRILGHERIYEALRDRLVEATRGLVMGDPKDDRTFIGPLISEGDAIRLEDWIRSAESRGARILCGGRRQGPMLEATLLENVPRDEKICAREAFGQSRSYRGSPTSTRLSTPSTTATMGCKPVVFTRDLYKMQRAGPARGRWVLVGDVPSWLFVSITCLTAV